MYVSIENKCLGLSSAGRELLDAGHFSKQADFGLGGGIRQGKDLTTTSRHGSKLVFSSFKA